MYHYEDSYDFGDHDVDYYKLGFNIGIIDDNNFPIDAQIGPGRIEIPEDNIETMFENEF